MLRVWPGLALPALLSSLFAPTAFAQRHGSGGAWGSGAGEPTVRACACPPSPSVPSPVDATRRVEREAWAMGTRLRLVVEAASASAAAGATEAALREVERLDALLSTWRPDSGLSAVNASAPGRALSAGPELVALLGEAEAWARRTGRAFDPAVGALVDAWGLRGAPRIPAPAELERALQATGRGVLGIDERAGVVVRHAAPGWVDSGGFGKGAALRSAAGVLRGSEIDRVLVELGGQLWASDPACGGWPVAVAHPSRRTEAAAWLRIEGVSVSTSGHGQRPGHLLDPRTGRPTPAWGSVTVVAADPLEADALSTALYVMGPEDGLAWARGRAGTAAMFLVETDEGVRAEWTPALERWLVAPSATPVAGPVSREGAGSPGASAP